MTTSTSPSIASDLDEREATAGRLHVPDLHVRDLHVPDLHVPDLHVPDLHVPDLHVPDLHVPDLHVEVWGSGTPVVLIHGSLATGADEWSAQHPLADEDMRLIVPDRRGYGRSPAAAGEDYLVDADDVVALMGTGAHLVGHSYGGLSAMLAAARRPEATLSLTVLEPPVASVGQHDAAWRALIDEVRQLWDRDLPDDEWVVRFLVLIGSDPESLSQALIDAAVELVPVFRHGRPFHDVEVPIAELAAATFPKLVVSGGHHAGFEAMSDDLANRIGAARAVVPGAGHEVQFTGEPINAALRSLWLTAR